MTADPILTAFANRVRLARDARKWSARELAAKADVSPATVCRAERGDHDLYLTVCTRIAAALEIPFSEMVTESVCDRCDGTPPAGFICGECKREGGAR